MRDEIDRLIEHLNEAKAKLLKAQGAK